MNAPMRLILLYSSLLLLCIACKNEKTKEKPIVEPVTDTVEVEETPSDTIVEEIEDKGPLTFDDPEMIDHYVEEVNERIDGMFKIYSPWYGGGDFAERYIGYYEDTALVYAEIPVNTGEYGQWINKFWYRKGNVVFSTTFGYEMGEVDKYYQFEQKLYFHDGELLDAQERYENMGKGMEHNIEEVPFKTFHPGVDLYQQSRTIRLAVHQKSFFKVFFKFDGERYEFVSANGEVYFEADTSNVTFKSILENKEDHDGQLVKITIEEREDEETGSTIMYATAFQLKNEYME